MSPRISLSTTTYSMRTMQAKVYTHYEIRSRGLDKALWCVGTGDYYAHYYCEYACGCVDAVSWLIGTALEDCDNLFCP